MTLHPTNFRLLCHAPEPKSEARQMPCTRETGPTSAQGSKLIQITN
ncbi:hypothetical protein SLEP1_g22543 [Rubroshorea leprosula]|uniref:Uncharacterized protein n=1 Tax=Rubroshorea leprosula TaxID=152421 RepID=A0AAV5JCJ1_9ROSI|nr:hypothetical protein SLEP1_g22543 [Rubroshorea leprosula]